MVYLTCSMLSLGCRYRRRSSQAGATTNVGGGDGDNDDDATPKRYLNGRITKLHNVRAEPIREAKVVGYLIATKEASRFSICGACAQRGENSSPPCVSRFFPWCPSVGRRGVGGRGPYCVELQVYKFPTGLAIDGTSHSTIMMSARSTKRIA